MDPKLSWMVTSHERTSPSKLRDTSITWSRVKSKRFISTFTRPQSPKLASVLNQDEGAQRKKLRDTSIVCSRKK